MCRKTTLLHHTVPQQGASWSSPRRGFYFHDTNPAAVTAHVGPADVPAGLLSGAAGASFAGNYAVWSDGTQVSLGRVGEGMPEGGPE